MFRNSAMCHRIGQFSHRISGSRRFLEVPDSIEEVYIMGPSFSTSYFQNPYRIRPKRLQESRENSVKSSVLHCSPLPSRKARSGPEE